MREIFLTFFYSGLLPKAPGTFGSIAGGVVGVLILSIAPVSTLFLLTILVSLIAIKEIDKEEASSKTHDASKIVIDEVVGIWLALIISSQTWLQIGLSFIFFRIYDIWKPSIIGKIDEDVKGGLGVMGDDIVAGIFAGLTSSIIYGAMLKMGLI